MALLTRTEEILLLSVYQLGEDAYGIAIRTKVEKLVGKSFSVGAIYVPLDRMAQRGLLENWYGDPTPERGGRSKKYYRLTHAGLQILRETKRFNDSLWSKIALALKLP